MIHNNSNLPMARYIKKSTFKDHCASFMATCVVIGIWAYCIHLADQVTWYV